MIKSGDIPKRHMQSQMMPGMPAGNLPTMGKSHLDIPSSGIMPP